ncbi:MAG: cell envelope integrity protein TolA [Limnohabitans sp.]
MTTAEHSVFAPPPAPGLGRSLALALLAHVLLFAALGLVTNWNTRPITVTAEAELWSAVPLAAAPTPVDTPQTLPSGPGTPPPQPAPPPAPQPAETPKVSEADIALQKKREKELQQAKEKEKQLAREKARKEQAEKDQKERETQEKKRHAEQRKKEEARQEAQEKAEAARAEALRQENLRRMQGLAGATGGENATGSAARSSGPSASYAGRLVGRIRPNIVMTGEIAGNPRTEVEVRVAADGTILSSRIVKSSGVKAWDDAVLRAIEKTEVFPKDIDGRVPPVMVLGFRPTD